ncbi:MAG TPA: TIM44-like domain-containing protein [Stellaceae bacterium]|nr:TIM44-like domain-containing protein [Stellaceae bacterium]
MAKWRNLALALLCALTLLTPNLADARAGGSFRGGGMSYGSEGSLGSRTYGSNGGQSVGRSMTPYSNPGSSSYGNGYGFGQNHPFLTGLGGALFGSWLGSMLFPHWGYGWGFGHVFGSLFSWIFIIFAISMLFRLFRRSHGPLTMPPLGGMGYGGPTAGYGPGGGYAPAAASRPITVSATDYTAFEAILKAVQGAWSQRDLRSLSHYVTPEMLSYFSEELAGNTSQGVENHVERIELLRGDVREAWEETNLQYATCLLHWRALDYTVRSDRKPGEPGWLVDGDAQHPSEAQELWTFARSRGGHWLLSAIQQI